MKHKYTPFVGARYAEGIKGKRVLVLGESHYVGDAADDNSELTHKVINKYVDEEHFPHDSWMNTYTRFVHALSGSLLSRQASREWWERVAFYNFVQSALPGPQQAPTETQFRQSDEAFREVLAKLQPDVVIVWGKRLYEHLPKEGRQGDDCCGIETWEYETGYGRWAKFLPIKHPSISFSPDEWHDIIVRFLSRQ